MLVVLRCLTDNKMAGLPLLLLALSYVLGLVAGQQCRQGWHYSNGSCYGFGASTVTWGDASEMCRAYGAKLAEIESSTENEYLKSMANTHHGQDYWLGGTDIFEEGSWEWVSTGEPILAFTDWQPGQPDDGGDHENCLILYGPYGYKWGDGGCWERKHFICESEPLETVVG